MSLIQDILSFHFSASRFAADATDLIAASTKRHIESVTREQQQIEIKHSGTGILKPLNPLLAYQVFISHADYGLDTLRKKFDTNGMVRQLAWALHYHPKGKYNSILQSKEYLNFALQILDERWGASMTIGVFETLLQHWNHPNAQMLRDFLAEKIKGYNGKRKTLLIIRNSRQFFLEKKGATSLSSDLLSHSRSLADACDFLELQGHMKHYAYFSEVAVAFVHFASRSPRFEDLMPGIMDFLQQHGQSSVAKRCLSKIIIRLKSSSMPDLREKVKVSALQLIGDPACDAYWKYESGAGASQEEIVEIKDAQQILNEWINQQFIDIFFRKLSMNYDRKTFWLRYAKYVSKFKIYSHQEVYHALANDLQIKQFLKDLKERFGFIQGVDKSQSALILVIKDYLFVEFSKTGGALYVYKPGNPKRPDILQKTLHRSDLCMQEIQNHLLQDGDEGRLIHSRGGWEYSLSQWMRQFLGVSV